MQLKWGKKQSVLDNCRKTLHRLLLQLLLGLSKRQLRRSSTSSSSNSSSSTLREQLTPPQQRQQLQCKLKLSFRRLLAAECSSGMASKCTTAQLATGSLITSRTVIIM